MDAKRTGLCCVSHSNNGFSLLQCKWPAYNMPHINVIKDFQWDEIQLDTIPLRFLKLGEWMLQRWVGAVAWIQKDVLVPVSLQSWYSGAMILWISHIYPTCLMIKTNWKYRTKIYKTLEISSEINTFILKRKNHDIKTINFR